MQAQQQQTPAAPIASSTGAKKLTWSERQAMAKTQQEEEEERSRAASFKPSANTGASVRAPTINIPPPPAAPPAPPVRVAPPVPVVAAAADDWEEEEEAEAIAPPLPPGRPLPPVTQETEPEAGDWGPPPPPVNLKNVIVQLNIYHSSL